jgi:hypothetical protein
MVRPLLRRTLTIVLVSTVILVFAMLTGVHQSALTVLGRRLGSNIVWRYHGISVGNPMTSRTTKSHSQAFSSLPKTNMRAVLIKDGKGPATNLYIGDAPESPSPNQTEVKVKVSSLRSLRTCDKWLTKK